MNHTSELTYTPAWWVPGPHLQTLWGRLARRALVVPTVAEQWTMPDGDEVALHRLRASGNGDASTPRVLLLHGLEGTIRSTYLQGTLEQVRRRGWWADVLIFRGCNGEVNRARRMYHSGETSDLAAVVERLVRENPGQPLVLAGFSLGGNVLLKWLGEPGTRVPAEVQGAVAVSVPYDLEAGARRLERGFSRIYTLHFLRSLRAKALRKLERMPGLFDDRALQQARTLFDFDDCVTAPIHGFDGARDYYTRSSSLQFIQGIRIPTLLLSSRDDPFMPPELLDTVADVARKNPIVATEFWNRGGHVGFVSGRSPLNTHYYAEERVVEFLSQVLRSPAAPRAGEQVRP